MIVTAAAALLLSPAFAAPASFAGVDALLAKASSLSASEAPAGPLTGPDGAGIRYAAQVFFLCKAVAARDEAPCGALRRVCFGGCPDDGPFHSSVDLCRSFRGRVLLSKALISHDPSARKQCLRQGPDMGERQVSAWQREGLCEKVLTQGEDDRTATCDRSRKENLSVTDPVTKSCEKGLSDYWGFSAPCAPEESLPKEESSGGGTHEAVTCLAANAAADFRKAFAARDAGQCGADGLCRAMMGGGGKACEPYGRELVDAQLRVLLARIEAALKAFEPKDAPGLDERRAKFESFRPRR